MASHNKCCCCQPESLFKIQTRFLCLEWRPSVEIGKSVYNLLGTRKEILFLPFKLPDVRDEIRNCINLLCKQLCSDWMLQVVFLAHQSGSISELLQYIKICFLHRIQCHCLFVCLDRQAAAEIICCKVSPIGLYTNYLSSQILRGGGLDPVSFSIKIRLS